MRVVINNIYFYETSLRSVIKGAFGGFYQVYGTNLMKVFY